MGGRKQLSRTENIVYQPQMLMAHLFQIEHI